MVNLFVSNLFIVKFMFCYCNVVMFIVLIIFTSLVSGFLELPCADVCVCACVCARLPLKPLIISGMIWTLCDSYNTSMRFVSDM